MKLKTFLKSSLKRVLGSAGIDLVKRVYRNRDNVADDGGRLAKLVTDLGSDKWGSHWYAQHYQHHFDPFRRKRVTLLEIGIGGDENPLGGGGSLRAWKQFFPHGSIVGIDIHDKKAHDARRIRTYRGDQADADFLRRVVAEIGVPDIIIDDGSHINDHVIASFEVLFPLLRDGGIYVVEDMQTSYWPRYGGGSKGSIEAPGATLMEFFKNFSDGLNHAEFLQPGYVPTYYDKHIVSMHFYHNLLFIYKGLNDEGSNCVKDGELQI